MARKGFHIEIIKSRLNSAKTSLCLAKTAEVSQELELSAEEQTGSEDRKEAAFFSWH